MKRELVGLLFMSIAVWLAGCGGVEQARARREVPGISSGVGRIDTSLEQATAEDFDYQGWKALRLTNGMVTVVVVPEIGGRIMEYKLGGHPFLWTNPAEARQRTSDSAKQTQWRDFGGYKAWPAPQAQWTPPPDPGAVTLDGVPWTGKITVPKGRTAEVEVVSPEDRFTGLQITRTIQLYGGSSRVKITEKFTSKSSQAAEWSVRQVAQVPGIVEPGAATSDKARVYLSLSPESKLADGYRVEGTAGAAQFKVLPNKLLQVAYQGREGEVFTDSQAGWVAYVDEAHGYTFAQRFGVSPLGNYPEQGSTVAVRVTAQPYLEISLFSPLRSLQPGDTLEVSSDWYAARVTGPIMNCSDVAALREPLKLTRKDNKLRLTGILGVFAPGNLALNLQDSAGSAIGQPTLVKVTPADEVKLNQEIAEEPTARKLVVELQNANGTPLGEVASLEMGAMIAKADHDKQ